MLKETANRFSLIDWICLVNLAYLCIMFLCCIGENPHKFQFGALILALLGILFFFRALIQATRHTFWGPILSVIGPTVFLLTVFQTLHLSVPYFNHQRYDTTLINIDYFMFGVHPTVWIEHIIVPWLTEVMYILYFAYFFLPVSPVIYLFVMKDYKRLEWTLGLFMSTFFVGYGIYFFFPATGPRFNLVSLQTVPLTGVFIGEKIRDLVIAMEPNIWDAMPSVHTSITIMTMLILFRLNKKLFVVFLPMALGILVSLVYCRYHYVIDIIAGAAYATAIFYFFEWKWKSYLSKFPSHVGI